MKLFLSNNNISSFAGVISTSATMPQLCELTLESNPIEKDSNLKNILKDKFPSLNSDYLSKLITYITSQKDRASRCSSLAREEASKCSFTAA